MRVIARPVPTSPRYTLPHLTTAQKPGLLYSLGGLCLLVAILPGLHLMSPRAGSPPASAGTSPQSWLRQTTLLTVYGRGFGIAPILGRLGMDRSLDDVAVQTQPVREQILANNAGRSVRLAIHLIYALATPCAADDRCLLYLDDTGVDLVKRYIEPAARRGWLVVLDDQVGRSTPAAEMRRLIRRGYLRYDNVEVAFDPEFRSLPGQAMPGVPTGFVTARQLNRAEELMSAYSSRLRLPHRKLLLVHQWNPDMIQDRGRLRVDAPYVQPVVVMDGIGAPAEKAHVYQSLFRSRTARGLLSGIKLFPPNPAVPSYPWDNPMLTWQQLFGRAPVDGLPGRTSYLRPMPSVVVLT